MLHFPSYLFLQNALFYPFQVKFLFSRVVQDLFLGTFHHVMKEKVIRLNIFMSTIMKNFRQFRLQYPFAFIGRAVYPVGGEG